MYGITNPVHATVFIYCSGPKNTTMLLQVFDARGRLVKTLFDGIAISGNIHAQWNTARCGNGVYFLKLKAGSAVQTQRVVVE
jgi:hypothetical protein